MKPCIRVRKVELPNGRFKRVFVIRVDKQGDPTCSTCWATYKATRGRTLTCRWCRADSDDLAAEPVLHLKNPHGRPATPNVKMAFQKTQGFKYTPPPIAATG